MLALFLFTFCVFLCFYVVLQRHANAQKKLPPGPVGVPVLGYLPFLDVFNLGAAFGKLSGRFGDICSLKVGTETAVVLNSYEAIRKTFSRPDFCARPDTFMFRFFSQGEKGIASASGETWEVQRKFAHKNLRALGFGRAKMEKFIKEEVKELVDILEEKSKSGKPVEIGYDINVSIVNVIWALISGERRPHDDERLRGFLKAVNEGIKLASTSGILLFMPWLIKILPERLFGIDKMRKWMASSYGFLKETVDEHKETFVEGQKRDFIDAFLQEMKNEGAHESFNDFQLLVLCSELFGAGGEPTSVTLKWALRFLALYPDIQKKAQEEIKKVVGQDRPVSLDDKESLPYIQALVQDIIRFSDIHPIGVLHSPSEDAELDGYKIPKGTFVFPNFHHVHRSPEHWENPDNLHPEHWLDSQGNFCPKHEGFLAFGVGKRKCPGQEVAQMELFCFLSNLIQKFTFKLSPGDQGRIESTPGVVVSPKDYSLVLECNK